MINKTDIQFKSPDFDEIFLPFKEFIKKEEAGGFLLFIATVIAMIWANSPFNNYYHAIWHTKLSIDIGLFHCSTTLLHFINDGLMALFFFVIGLEIKREMLVGALATFEQAILPVAAAIGGMLVPAAIYYLFNSGTPGSSGWGVPMATVIAFSLGILALLGKRVPLSLKVFLTAVAVADDIGAIIVISVFYTSKISWIPVGDAANHILFIMDDKQNRHKRAFCLCFSGYRGLGGICSVWHSCDCFRCNCCDVYSCSK